jgi:hypothetical protein
MSLALMVAGFFLFPEKEDKDVEDEYRDAIYKRAKGAACPVNFTAAQNGHPPPPPKNRLFFTENSRNRLFSQSFNAVARADIHSVRAAGFILQEAFYV